MKDKIKWILYFRADKMSSDDNVYFLEIEEYTSVLNSLKFFYKGNKNILNTSNRSNRLHKFLALAASDWENKPYKKFAKIKSDMPFIEKGYTYIEKQLKDGWEILSVEQLMYDTQEKIAGIADLLLYKTKTKLIYGHKAVRDYSKYNGQYCEECNRDADDHYEITNKVKIVGWETDELKASDYAQINVYKYLLEKSLGNDLNKQITIETELVSLEPKGETNGRMN